MRELKKRDFKEIRLQILCSCFFITISKGVTIQSYTSKICFKSLKFVAYTNTALKPKINLIQIQIHSLTNCTKIR